MARHHTIVTAKGKKSGKKSGKIRHMTITPSDNGGFSTETFHHPDQTDEKSMYSAMDNPVRSVHESPESMVDHVSKTFGANPAADGDEDDEDDDEK